MQAIKGFVTVKNRQVIIDLPEGFADNEEVEVIVLAKSSDQEDLGFWRDDELADIGKIGLHSQSFLEDDEDYST